jgi:transposase
LGTKVIVCKPADPEAKGIIERAHDYLERSFLPGRTFSGPTDFNIQMSQWLALVNTRRRRALGCSPTDRITADRQAMLALPPVAPETGWRRSARLPRDHYIRLDSNDYSVHPCVIGRRIEIVADLERVRVLSGGRVVADHERIWAWHQTIWRPRPCCGGESDASQPNRCPATGPRAGGRATVPCRLRHRTRCRLEGGVA